MKTHKETCINYQSETRLCTYVSPYLKKRVKEITEKTGEKQSALLCNALEFYLKDLDSKNKF